MAFCFLPVHRLQAVAELMMSFCDIAKTCKDGLKVQPGWQKLCVCVWKEVKKKRKKKNKYDGVSQNMKSDPASSRAATTPQTSCMQKHRNSQGVNQPTTQVCVAVSPNALEKGDCGEPWSEEVKPQGHCGAVLTSTVSYMEVSDN